VHRITYRSGAMPPQRFSSCASHTSALLVQMRQMRQLVIVHNVASEKRQEGEKRSLHGTQRRGARQEREKSSLHATEKRSLQFGVARHLDSNDNTSVTIASQYFVLGRRRKERSGKREQECLGQREQECLGQREQECLGERVLRRESRCV